VDQEFQTLYEIYPNNIRIVDIYKELYKEVLINYEQFIKYKNMHGENSQVKEESKLIRPNHQVKFTANEDLIVINSSLNVVNDIFHGGCEIVSVTSNVYKVLGYASQELIGKNINRFLPKLYCEFHDQAIDRYLTRDAHELKPRELIIFPINANGYVVECAMVNKIMPSLEYGVNIISFLLNSKLSKENLIIYDQRTGLVDSMSEKAESLILGRKNKKNSISIPDHISDILPVWDYVKEEHKDEQRRNSQEFHFTVRNVQLYRSDGPEESKHVKVISFEVNFHSKIFTMNECMIDNDNIWLGIQTLVDNSPRTIELPNKPGHLEPIIHE
jgi:PAS domain S-box-containing protein